MTLDVYVSLRLDEAYENHIVLVNGELGGGFRVKLLGGAPSRAFEALLAANGLSYDPAELDVKLLGRISVVVRGEGYYDAVARNDALSRAMYTLNTHSKIWLYWDQPMSAGPFYEGIVTSYNDDLRQTDPPLVRHRPAVWS